MATWHQAKAGLSALYRPHATGWKVISDPRGGGFASAIVLTDQAEAETLAKRNGGRVIPPDAT